MALNVHVSVTTISFCSPSPNSFADLYFMKMVSMDMWICSSFPHLKYPPSSEVGKKFRLSWLRCTEITQHSGGGIFKWFINTFCHTPSLHYPNIPNLSICLSANLLNTDKTIFFPLQLAGLLLPPSKCFLCVITDFNNSNKSPHKSQLIGWTPPLTFPSTEVTPVDLIRSRWKHLTLEELTILLYCTDMRQII